MSFDTEGNSDPAPQNPLDEGAGAADPDGSWAETHARLDATLERLGGGAPGEPDAPAGLPTPAKENPVKADPAAASDEPARRSVETLDPAGDARVPAQESVTRHRPFPLDALPPWLREMVTGTAHLTQTPLDLPGALGLGVLATCVAGHVKVEARPGWVEPTNLFVVVAMPPGSRKSAVHQRLTRPLTRIEAELTNALMPKINEASTRKAILTKAADIAMKAAAKEPANGELLKAAVTADEQAKAVLVPAKPRVFVDDITQESLASTLHDQGGRLAVLSAEGGIFGILAGRYSAKGAPNLDIFLKGHAGDAVRVDRTGRKPEHIDEPALTLDLTVQPEVLKDLGRNKAFKGRGLLARILFVIPANNVGTRKVAPPPVSPVIYAAYDERVTNLYQVMNGLTETVVLALSPEAEALLTRFERELEPRLAVEGDLGDLTDWAAKVTGAVVRIAGLLHLAGDDPANAIHTPVSEVEVASAIAFGEYFIDQAREAFAIIDGDESISRARTVDGFLRRHKITSITGQQLFSRLSRSRFPKMTDLLPALEILEENAVIQRQEQPPSGTSGRPRSPIYVVVGAEEVG